MDIKVNTIVTLKNNEAYVVLNSIMYENKEYFLVMGLDENKDVIPSKVLIIEPVKKDEKQYIKIIKDQDLIIKLTSLLKAQM